MFTGHFAAALTGAGTSRRLSLGALIFAAFGADILEGVVAAFNVRDTTRVWSHSLPATFAVGVVCALLVIVARGTWRDAVIILLVAVSHTALDFVTAVKTVWPGVPPMGWDLYSRPVLETFIELGCCVAGWMLWRASLEPGRRASRPAWAMLAVLVLAQGVMLLAVTIGPVHDSDALSKFVR